MLKNNHTQILEDKSFHLPRLENQELQKERLSQRSSFILNRIIRRYK